MRARGKRSDDANSTQQQRGSAPTRTNSQTSNHRPSDEQTTGAARRVASEALSQIEDEIGSTNELGSTVSNRMVFGLNPRANKVKHDEYAERRAKQLQSSNDDDVKASSNKLTDKSKIRASRYGNSQQPQDLVVVTSSGEPKKVLVRQRSESPERRKVTTTTLVTGSHQLAHSEANEKDTKATRAVRREDKYKSPSSSAMATENSEPRNKTTGSDLTPANGKQQPDQNKQQPRTQFYIPPPPKLNSGSATKSSIISYAKSRIYDKQQLSQTKHQAALGNGPAGSGALLDNNNIPESILSGFKPPKQVNVSKARERWEGGEPFAKCKSRQRLAQSANKRVLYGTWSMTSVVATQQMQFQQALAESSKCGSFAALNQSHNPNDTPVKILTRGSVLERVQQYEQVPANLRSNGSGGSLSSSTGSLYSSSSSSSSSSTTSSTVGDLGSLSPPIAGVSQTTTQSAAANEPSSIQTQHPSPAKTALKSPPSDQIAASLNRRFSFRRRSSASSFSSPAIPRFYHPNGKPNTYEIELQKKNIVACFDKFTDRKALLTAPAYKRHFHSIALACGFSEYFKEPLYHYIKHQMTNSNLLHQTSPARKQSSGFSPSLSSNGTYSTTTTTSTSAAKNGLQRTTLLTRAASIDNSTVEKIQAQNYISCEQFLTCWRHLIGSCFDNPARFVHLLTLGQRNYLLPEDFVSLIQSVIDDHPGLKFLRTAPDFHMRYIQTVIARIYFCINRSWTGKLSLCELRRSNLLQVLESLAREEDINQITDYFSYEHFYVIYCKFWSLDQDHDLLISKEDLARHNDASISSRIIDRIFTGIVSKRIQETGRMSYSDFVWFLIAEEDKKHQRSVEYWFRLMDIDGDGYISMYEMEYFYYEQTKRLEMMNIEALPFLDSACQILDLINPKEKSKISLSDLKKTKLATIFFDTFINLEKYLEHESREFVSTRDCVQNGQVVSDWDRYASEAYESLVSEESSV